MRPDPPSAPILLHCCTMKPARSFASDNNAGIHPEVLKAISAANHGHAVGYGDDPYTSSAVQKFKQHFGDNAEVFIVFNGTAANCLSLKALTDSFHAVICTAGACARPLATSASTCSLSAAPRTVSWAPKRSSSSIESSLAIFSTCANRACSLPPKCVSSPPSSTLY